MSLTPPSLTNEPICLFFQKNPLCSYIVIGNCVRVKSSGLAPGRRKICKCPTPEIDKEGKCPVVARGGEGGWAQLELTDG